MSSDALTQWSKGFYNCNGFLFTLFDYIMFYLL